MRPSPPMRSEYRYFASHTTRWMDNDSYGHLNNVVHYSLMDTTVNLWLHAQGFAQPHIPVMGLVVESGCEYFAELFYPEPITMGLRIGRIGTSSVRYELALFGGTQDRAAAAGHFTHVYVDPHQRRPAPLPDTMRAAMQALLVG